MQNMDRSKINPLNPPRQGVFEQALSLDLSGVTSKKKFADGYPLSLRRLLGSVNIGMKPTGDAGILGLDSESVSDGLNTAIEVIKRLKSAPAASIGQGLPTIEEDNFSKIVDASGFRPMAHFMDDKYPWMVQDNIDSRHKDGFLSACDQLGKLLKRICDHAKLPIGSKYTASNLHKGSYDIAYRKGSSYGVYPYVPGSSKLNGVALAYHGLTACQISAYVSNKTNTVNIGKINEVVMNDLKTTPYTSDPLAIMMIRRARPLGPNKKIPLWLPGSKPGTYHAKEWESGVSAGTREIKAINASLNMTATGMAQYLGAILALIPGTHVGHLVQSPDILRHAYDLWGNMDTHIHVEDISGYDNSVGPTHTEGFYNILCGVFNLTKNDIDLMRIVDTLPIMTCGMIDGRDEYTLLDRQFGIASGDQTTTARGTFINMASKIYSVMMSGKISFSESIERCLNFRVFFGLSTSPCTWGFMLKGDDVIMFNKKNKLGMDAFSNGMKTLGFKTDVEPGPIFLMNYINTNHKIVGSEYPYCPKKFLDNKSFASHGLGGKRLGNRILFVEHPLRDIRPARFAIASNIRDMWFHPQKDLINQSLMRILNRAEKKAGTPHQWTEGNLLLYTVSPAGVKDMNEFAQTKGGTDPFSRELLRRSSWSSGASSSQFSGLSGEDGDSDGISSFDIGDDMDPGLAILVKSMSDFSVPGFGTSAIGDVIKEKTNIEFKDDSDSMVMSVGTTDVSKLVKGRNDVLQILLTK